MNLSFADPSATTSQRERRERLGQLNELLNPRLSGPEASYNDRLAIW